MIHWLVMTKEAILPRHRRVEQLFTGKNTTNERLKRLYQHRFLERRWLPVEYGQGMSQAIYLLGERGADLVAERQGIDRGAVGWQKSHNRVGSPFLEHSLMINDVRIAFTVGAQAAGYEVNTWVGEDELKAVGDHVYIPSQNGGQRKVAVIPDGYLVLNLGHKQAHFFLEIDRATLSNKRWRERVRAYLVYTQSGRYTERYGTRSLRVLTVTTGLKRLANLKHSTEDAGGHAMFWFTTLRDTTPDRVLGQPIWQVAGEENSACLIA